VEMSFYPPYGRQGPHRNDRKRQDSCVSRQPYRPASLLDQRSLKRLSLLVALVLCLFAFVLVSSGEAWAEEQPYPTVQQRTVEGTIESTTVVNGNVIGTVPGETSLAVGGAPVETPLAENPPTPPSYPAPPTPIPEPAPEPTPLRQAVVITAGEVKSEPGTTSAPTPTFQETEPEPTPTRPPDSPSVPHPPGTVSVEVDTTPVPTLEDAVPTPDLGPSATEVPASTTVDPSPSWELEPTSPPGAIQPIQRVEQVALPHLISTNLASAAGAAANVLGTVGSWLSETPAPDRDTLTGSITPEPLVPLAPLTPLPFGDNDLSLFYGGGSPTGAGGGSALLLPLWGVFTLAAILLRRNGRTCLISCEVPKPSSALLSPLERPG
jgi:hypothetical protein